jgi:hypothetical protein
MVILQTFSEGYNNEHLRVIDLVIAIWTWMIKYPNWFNMSDYRLNSILRNV